MSSRETKLGLIAVAGLVAALPFADGCKSTGSFDNGDFLSGDLTPTSNARFAMIETFKKNDGTGGIAGSSRRGATGSATITADGTTASFKPDSDGVEPQSGLPINHAADPSEVYGDPDSSIAVERQAGLNEAGDTFLTYHETHDGNFTTYARGYAGTRSDAGVITAARNATSPRMAIYDGAGSAYVGQGDFAYFVDGALRMNVQFNGATAGIAGKITDTSVTSATEDNPNGVNQVTFTGAFRDGSPDYDINDIRLNATSSANTDNPSGQVATIKQGGGVGSFFGSTAQGTMGAFTGTGLTTTSGGKDESEVNVIGSFAGKAAAP